MRSTYLFLCLLFACSVQCAAQMTAEHTYSSSSIFAGIVVENGGTSVMGPVLVNLAVSGKKYAVCESGNLNLYNLDHTLWKAIPMQYDSNTSAVIFFISENLFKLDGKVEFAVSYSPLSGGNTMYVKDEDGNTLNTMGGMYWMYLYKSAPDTTKAIVAQGYPGTTNTVYTLPGSLPCEQCANGPSLKTADMGQVLDAVLSDPVPNPSNAQTRIDYKLPAAMATAEITLYNAAGQQVASRPATQGGHSVFIDVSRLAAGEYYYILRSGMQHTGARKMLVTK